MMVDWIDSLKYYVSTPKSDKTVCGVAINDSLEPVFVNGVVITSYECWSSMIKRCYYEHYSYRRPRYKGCTICTEWLTFSNFKKWYDANYRTGMHLDKDILVEGNKIYSPETCRFIPHHINTLLCDRLNGRGELPLGISARNGKNGAITYMARCHIENDNRISKTFKTIEEAVSWYSITKTRIVREVAQRALDAGEIGYDIFHALISRKF